MPQREYDIVINRDGTVELKIQGHPGRSCLDVAKLFAEIVGKQTDQQLTQEYYEPEQEVRSHLDQYQ